MTNEYLMEANGFFTNLMYYRRHNGRRNMQAGRKLYNLVDWYSFDNGIQVYCDFHRGTCTTIKVPQQLCQLTVARTLIESDWPMALRFQCRLTEIQKEFVKECYDITVSMYPDVLKEES
ncbi:MAG: hypothetical protein LUG25_03530 [Oscillospiraceae bacterium]|nr:hypothetical protein [Oscillospiraceae bacterium]